MVEIDVTIVITTYNEKKYFHILLNSIKKYMKKRDENNYSDSIR